MMSYHSFVTAGGSEVIVDSTMLAVSAEFDANAGPWLSRCFGPQGDDDVKDDGLAPDPS